MAVEVAPPGAVPPRAALRPLVVVGALTALGVGLRLLDPGRVAWVQNFLIVFGGLLIEAVPFVLLGALVSAAIEVFVPATAFERLARLPRPLQLPAAGLAGLAFPVCECGSVPVARRMAAKGLLPGAAVTFMLAAPIVNPVVIAATFVAYQGRDALWTMVLGRVGLGLAVAVAAGWVMGTSSREELLRPLAPGPEPIALGRPEPRWSAFFGHLAGDFLFMGRFLVLGATAAATVQTFVPQTVVGLVADTPVVSLLAMMGLAFLLSLCSESDAFVAASFVRFGPAAQLAFLVFGPVVDMKLAALYMGTYRRGFTRTVVVVAAAVTLVGTLWIEVFAG
ncbi:MAG TPA: permease [Actinomycetota bacterium]|nr:permease [Actinomycetota bacterium]